MSSNAKTTPGVKPPSGERSNFVDPPSQKGLIVTVAVLAITLSTLFVCLRIYTRRFINRRLWWDDWTCILGWVGLITLAGLMFKALNYGGGVDLWNVPKAKYKRFTKAFHNIEIVGRVAMFFTKASIVLLYQRIFIPTQSRKTVIWWAIWFVFWWNLLYTVAVILTVTTECVGKEDEVAKGEQCLNQSAFVISATVINVVSDLMILIIPIVAIWGLQMAKRPKLRLSAVFAVGLMQVSIILPLVSNEKADTGYRGVFASVARLGYLIPEAGRPNQTVIVMALLMLNIAEQTSGIIVGCLPVLPSLYRHWSEHHFTSNSNKSSAKVFVNSFFANKRGLKASNSNLQSDDPSTLRAYEELDEV